jgi:protein-disulfide isomerase
MPNRGKLINMLFCMLLAAWLIAVAAKAGVFMWKSRRNGGVPTIGRVDEWRSLIKGRRTSLGVNGAPVVIIEFSDYQCPFCRIVEPRLEQLVSEHHNQVAIYRFDFPQEKLHPYSIRAAIAARCAEEQGVTETYQRALFEEQINFNNKSWVEIARETGISNVDAFQACMKKDEIANQVRGDLEMSKRIGIPGTPSLAVNGMLTSGALTAYDLERLYSAARRNRGTDSEK